MDFVNQASAAVREKSSEIRAWEISHLEKIFVPFYSSADIRVSSEKTAVVDTNIFPAGFNNLSEDFRRRLGFLVRGGISEKYPGAEKLLIVPEVHTRNAYYWENIKTLETVLEDNGFEVKIGFVDENIERESVYMAAKTGSVEARKAGGTGGRIAVGDFVPDVVLLNNDFSDDCPSIFRDAAQPILPPVEIGWHSRRKDIHFEFYNSLAAEAADVAGIDPRTIFIQTRLVEDVNFDEADGREKVALIADEMIGRLKSDRNDGSPFLFVKSNKGTYGMAVISVSDSDEVRRMNLENRKKMRAGKSKNPVREVVLQEGVPTALRTADGLPAEPVLYMVETEVAGAFYRANSKKGATQNLNSSGMEFQFFPDAVKGFDKIPELFSLCAKIAVIAAGYEIEKVMLEGGCG